MMIQILSRAQVEDSQGTGRRRPYTLTDILNFKRETELCPA